MKKLLRSILPLAALLLPALSFAQEAAPAAVPAAGAEGGDIFGMTWSEIFTYGGTVLWLIVGVSVIAFAYVLWLFFMLRPSNAVPPPLASETIDLIREGKLDKAEILCDGAPCAYASVAKRAIAFVRTTPHADPVLLKEIIAGEGATQAAAILARPQRLSLAISIAPMLGLLGTVIGMLRSFISIAGDVAAAKPVQLAQGMSQAIITTIAGLIVAIAASLFHAWFNIRAEHAVARLSSAADDLLTALLSYQQTR